MALPFSIPSLAVASVEAVGAQVAAGSGTDATNNKGCEYTIPEVGVEGLKVTDDQIITQTGSYQKDRT